MNTNSIEPDKKTRRNRFQRRGRRDAKDAEKGKFLSVIPFFSAISASLRTLRLRSYVFNIHAIALRRETKRRQQLRLPLDEPDGSN